MWPFTLSGRLSIVAMVGRYPTIKLMERGLILKRQVAPPLIPRRCRPEISSGIRPSFPGLSQTQGQITHVLLTRSPLYLPDYGRNRSLSFLVRLACIRHAASVRSEPGSNSPSILNHILARFKTTNSIRLESLRFVARIVTDGNSLR